MTVLALPAVIDTASVGALRNQLAERRGQALDVEVSGVERIGALGLQLLLSAIRTWAADGQALTLTGASPSLQEMLRATGAAELPEFKS